MSGSRFEQFGGPAIKIVVVFLAALSIVGGYTQLSIHGLSAIGDAFVSFYIAALILWGVFVEGFDTLRFRALLYVGLVLWGGVTIASDPDATWALLLIGLGVVLLGRTLYKLYEHRTKPVYER